MQKLADFFTNQMVRPVAKAADADHDVVSFHWLCVEDENPGDNNKPPQEAAGAMVFIKGDAEARLLAAWAEAQGWLTPRVMVAPQAPAAHPPGDVVADPEP